MSRVARPPCGAFTRLGRISIHAIHYADLLRLTDMKRVAADIAKVEPRIDVLINNAGAIFSERRLTEDGLERTFALNHMAYFVVTLGLLERLSASGAARIINTASGAHRGGQAGFRRFAVCNELRWHGCLPAIEIM